MTFNLPKVIPVKSVINTCLYSSQYHTNAFTLEQTISSSKYGCSPLRHDDQSHLLSKEIVVEPFFSDLAADSPFSKTFRF